MPSPASSSGWGLRAWWADSGPVDLRSSESRPCPCSARLTFVGARLLSNSPGCSIAARRVAPPRAGVRQHHPGRRGRCAHGGEPARGPSALVSAGARARPWTPRRPRVGDDDDLRHGIPADPDVPARRHALGPGAGHQRRPARNGDARARGLARRRMVTRPFGPARPGGVCCLLLVDSPYAARSSAASDRAAAPRLVDVAHASRRGRT